MALAPLLVAAVSIYGLVAYPSNVTELVGRLGVAASMTREGATTSVITTVFERRDHLGRQRRSLDTSGNDVEHVIVDLGGPAIDPDGDVVVRYPVGSDQPLPLAAARNAGAQHATGDVFIFLDVDCIAGPDFIHGYRRHVEWIDALWCSPVGYLPPSESISDWSVEHLRSIVRIQDGRPRFGSAAAQSERYDLFWSLSFAVPRGTWERIGGFDERYVGYGGEDTDFARMAQAAGVDLWFAGDPVAFHQHHPVSDPPVEHLDAIVRNASIFYDKWGSWPMEGWLAKFERMGEIEWDPAGSRLFRRVV